MTECNHEAFSFSNCRKRQVRGNFAGGSISSNGGALLLREVDRRIGLTARVARALGDARRARLAKIHMRGEDGSLAPQMELEIPQEPPSSRWAGADSTEPSATTSASSA